MKDRGNAMFKELFNTACAIIFRPTDAWKVLRDKSTDDRETFLSRYIYPFIGLIALAAFLGVLFTRKEFDVQTALKSAILSLLSSLGGFYLSAYLLNELRNRFFHEERDMKLCQFFVGYSSSLIFSLNIILSLLPDLFFLRFIVLYTVYIVWEGAIPYMKVNEKDQFKFVVVSTAVILATPMLLEFMLKMLMPGLRF